MMIREQRDTWLEIDDTESFGLSQVAVDDNEALKALSKPLVGVLDRSVEAGSLRAPNLDAHRRREVRDPGVLTQHNDLTRRAGLDDALGQTPGNTGDVEVVVSSKSIFGEVESLEGNNNGLGHRGACYVAVAWLPLPR